jgi:hypothetical protein
MIRNLVITLLTAMSLASCVIVPAEHYHGWHDRGRYHNYYPEYRR